MRFGPALAVVLLAAAGLRLVHRDADPPPGFVQGSLAESTDEGFKTLHARNRVQFGSWLSHPEDRYVTWLRRGPVAVGVQAAWFRLRGRVDVVTAREPHVLAGLLGLLLWVRAVRAELGDRAALLTGAFLASSASATVYGRLAFLENFLLLAVGAGAWLLCGPRPRPLAAAVVALLGLFVKPTMLLVLAAVAGTAALRRVPRRIAGGLAGAAGVAYLALWLVPGAGAAILPLPQRDAIAGPLQLLRNLFLTQFAAREGFLLALALPGAALAVRGGARLPAAAAGWLLFGWLGLALVEGDADRVRYYVVLLPPLALCAALALLAGADAARLWPWALPGLAGLGLAVALPWLEEPLRTLARGGRAGPAALGGLAIAVLAVALPRWPARVLAGAALLCGPLRLLPWLVDPPREQQAARADLERRLSADALLAGQWAPALTLGTPLRAIRTSHDLNLRGGRLARIRPSHLVLADDRPEDRAAFEREHPGMLDARRLLAVYTVDRFVLRLYRLEWP